MASFESLQERLAALQETTGQLRELIDRLANIHFQPGSVPLSASDEDNVATELSTEIGQILREEEVALEFLGGFEAAAGGELGLAEGGAAVFEVGP